MIEASKIASKIYQGSAPPVGPYVAEDGFNVLVLAAQEYQPRHNEYPGVEAVIHAGINDAVLTLEELQKVRRAAKYVADAVRKGKRVLITCRQGRNRSGIITALTLYNLTGEPGGKIVRLIKSKRLNALTNRSFVDFLDKLPKVRR